MPNEPVNGREPTFPRKIGSVRSLDPEASPEKKARPR
jgi:hypothetical protein